MPGNEVPFLQLQLILSHCFTHAQCGALWQLSPWGPRTVFELWMASNISCRKSLAAAASLNLSTSPCDDIPTAAQWATNDMLKTSKGIFLIHVLQIGLGGSHQWLVQLRARYIEMYCMNDHERYVHVCTRYMYKLRWLRNYIT